MPNPMTLSIPSMFPLPHSRRDSRLPRPSQRKMPPPLQSKPHPRAVPSHPRGKRFELQL